jgi:hypothetical protein
MDQDLRHPEQDPGTVLPSEVQAAPARAPYRKPEVFSDYGPLLALLTSQCTGEVTPAP